MDNDEVLFVEHRAAARSMKSAWTRWASTYGCMRIVLSRRTLVVKPHGLAKWPIRLLGLDLWHEIPVSRIRGVVERGRSFSYGEVEVRFQTAETEDRRLLLYSRKERELLDLLREVRGTGS